MRPRSWRTPPRWRHRAGAAARARRPAAPGRPAPDPPDRKSTRLNSSHVKISYAVFCLKKKTEQSNTAVVPPTLETENHSWADQKQKGIRELSDRRTHKIDHMCDEPDQEQRGDATHRVM